MKDFFRFRSKTPQPPQNQNLQDIHRNNTTVQFRNMDSYNNTGKQPQLFPPETPQDSNQCPLPQDRLQRKTIQNYQANPHQRDHQEKTTCTSRSHSPSGSRHTSTEGPPVLSHTPQAPSRQTSPHLACSGYQRPHKDTHTPQH